MYDPLRDVFEELKGSGVALGVNEAFDYKENNRRGLSNGQIIAIGTDGIWEAVNKEGEMFGKSRFKELVRNNAGLEAEGIRKAVFEAVTDYRGDEPQEDDITLVVLKFF